MKGRYHPATIVVENLSHGIAGILVARIPHTIISTARNVAPSTITRICDSEYEIEQKMRKIANVLCQESRAKHIFIQASYPYSFRRTYPQHLVDSDETYVIKTLTVAQTNTGHELEDWRVELTGSQRPHCVSGPAWLDKETGKRRLHFYGVQFNLSTNLGPHSKPSQEDLESLDPGLLYELYIAGAIDLDSTLAENLYATMALR